MLRFLCLILQVTKYIKWVCKEEQMKNVVLGLTHNLSVADKQLAFVSIPQEAYW